MRTRRSTIALLAAIGCGLSPAANACPRIGFPAQQEVDRIAARVEDDIITESEVRELAAFQRVVDGKAQGRDEVIRELVEQWIARGEARASKYPEPSTSDVDHAYTQLAAQFRSPQEFESRYAVEGMSKAAVRRLLDQQLYLARFLDTRFRPTVQVSDMQVENYYRDEFAPQLKARGQAIPALDAVDDAIREVLVQRAISARAKEWMDETRMRLKIVILPERENR